MEPVFSDWLTGTLSNEGWGPRDDKIVQFTSHYFLYFPIFHLKYSYIFLIFCPSEFLYSYFFVKKVTGRPVIDIYLFSERSISFFNSKQQILPHTTEHELHGLPPDLGDVFNDVSLHLFNTHNARVADEFWSDADEPHYRGNEFDQEIVWNEQSQLQSSTWNCCENDDF